MVRRAVRLQNIRRQTLNSGEQDGPYMFSFSHGKVPFEIDRKQIWMCLDLNLQVSPFTAY